jgi:NAD(P)-dependent dehydrogenase (short-subunit alcohol dehydrogenase family)
MAGYVHGIGSPLYFASKHGVHAFVRSLGRLRDAVGIRTAAIAPGAVNVSSYQPKRREPWLTVRFCLDTAMERRSR